MNPYEPPKAPLNNDVDLGPVVFSCPDRSMKGRWEALDLNPLRYYIMALWVPIIPVGLLVLAVGQLGLGLSPQGFQIIFGVTYTIALAGLYWMFNRRPKQPSLVLHERGFRFRRQLIPFDELTSIRFGRGLSAMESATGRLNRYLGEMHWGVASAAQLAETQREGSVTLVYKTGLTRAVNQMLIRPESEGLKQFFERLRALRPGLAEDTPSTSLIAPGLDDLPFKMTSL